MNIEQFKELNIFDILVDIYNYDYIEYMPKSKKEYNDIIAIEKMGLIEYKKEINAFTLTDLGLKVYEKFKDRI